MDFRPRLRQDIDYFYNHLGGGAGELMKVDKLKERQVG